MFKQTGWKNNQLDLERIVRDSIDTFFNRYIVYRDISMLVDEFNTRLAYNYRFTWKIGNSIIYQGSIYIPYSVCKCRLTRKVYKQLNDQLRDYEIHKLDYIVQDLVKQEKPKYTNFLNVRGLSNHLQGMQNMITRLS